MSLGGCDAPDVDRDQAARVAPVQLARHVVDVAALAARSGPLPATSLARLQAMIDGCRRSWRTLRRTRSRAAAARRGVSDVQAPGASTGPTPCQTMIPAASRRSSSAGGSACWARVALASIAFSSATIASMSLGVSASPRPGASSLSDAPCSSTRRPLSRMLVAAPAQIAQAGATRPAGLPGRPRAAGRRGWERPGSTAPGSRPSRWCGSHAQRAGADLTVGNGQRRCSGRRGPGCRGAARRAPRWRSCARARRRRDLRGAVGVQPRRERRGDEVDVGKLAQRDRAG